MMALNQAISLFLVASLSIGSWAYFTDDARNELGRNEPHTIQARSPRIRFNSNKRDLQDEPTPADSLHNGYPPIKRDESVDEASSQSGEDDSIPIEARAPRVRFHGNKRKHMDGGSSYNDEEDIELSQRVGDYNIPADSHMVATRGPRVRFHDTPGQMGSAQDGFKRNQMEKPHAGLRHRRSPGQLRWSFNNDMKVVVDAFWEKYNEELQEKYARMREDMLSKGK